MSKLNELVEIVKTLRGPNGCPWDREQTFESLKPSFLEEVYEVLEVMDIGGEELKGELGDLLLHIVFQVNMSEEKGQFNMDDVVSIVSEKMIRRHPHVFGEQPDIKTSDDVLIEWEKIKAKEKGHEKRKSILDGIPKGLPALLSADKIQKKVSKVGFDWPNIKGTLDKVSEEIEELKIEINNNEKEKMEEEFGDLLFALVNVGRHLDINPEIALEKANKKFKKRFEYIEKNCILGEASLEEMDSLWNEAKEKTKA